VVFLSQLTLFSDNHDVVFRRRAGALRGELRFVGGEVLRDQFGEHPRSTPARALSAAAAEAWCLEGWPSAPWAWRRTVLSGLRFELRTADQKDSRRAGEPGLNLRSLIELFSRRPGPDDPNWTREVGPLRLEDLRRAVGRGARNG